MTDQAEPAVRPRLVVAYAALPAHELLRTEAARFHDLPLDRIVLDHRCERCGSHEHGRPQLVPTRALRTPAHVSLARAGDLSVVALTDVGPVGIDVEREGAADFPGFDDVARHPHDHGTPERTRDWVRTEALLKAYGLGLAVDPRDVAIDSDGSVTWHSPHERPGAVWLRDVEVPGHVVSVVVLPGDDQALAHITIELRAHRP